MDISPLIAAVVTALSSLHPAMALLLLGMAAAIWLLRKDRADLQARLDAALSRNGELVDKMATKTEVFGEHLVDLAKEIGEILRRQK